MKNILLTALVFILLGLNSFKINSQNNEAISSKTIESLFVLLPDVYVSFEDYRGRKGQDKDLENIIKTDLILNTEKILKRKYELTIDTLAYITDSTHYSNTEKLISIVDTLKSQEHNFSIKYFEERTKNISQNYFLFTIFRAQYFIENPYQAPGQTRIYLNQFNKTHMNEYIFLYDKINRKIVYYNKRSNQDDARYPSLIERMNMKVLKKIYYKKYL